MSDLLPANLTRNQLQAMAPNQRALRALEQMLRQVNEAIPANISEIRVLVEEAITAAENGSSVGRQVSDALSEFADSTQSDIASMQSLLSQVIEEIRMVDADASTASAVNSAQISAILAALEGIDSSLSLIANAPATERENNATAADYIDLPVTIGNPAYREGRVFYDKNEHTLAYYNENAQATVNVGQEQIIRVTNTTGTAISNGRAVYVSGASSGHPSVSLAKADASPTSQSILGVTTTDIPNGGFGYVCVLGMVNGIDTSAYPAGTILYLSPAVAGGLTSVSPVQPNYVVEVCEVLTQSAIDGRVFVHVDKKPWFPSIEIVDNTATLALPTTDSIIKPPLVIYNDGFTYDSSTGEITFNRSGSYTVTIQINATPSAANKNIYFYFDEDYGSGWVPRLYSGRQLVLPNSTETPLVIDASRYYEVGWKLRFHAWGDATVSLKTTDLPGTTPGTVKKPAWRCLIA